jgi:hypothetical protein
MVDETSETADLTNKFFFPGWWTAKWINLS